MPREYLIQRYEHHYFRGWKVGTKRQGKRFARCFSDKPHGRAGALRAARAYRDKLVSRLPRPHKVMRSYVLKTTGIIGVALTKEQTRSGKLLRRYVASWLKHDGERGKASFSVGLYGEKEAFRLAICARRAALEELQVVE